MAFDPDFATNKFVFVGHCVGGRPGLALHALHLQQRECSPTGQQILAIAGGNASGNSWHSVGSMGFDKNKNLWMLHGEFVTGAPGPEHLGATWASCTGWRPAVRRAWAGSCPPKATPAATPVLCARVCASPWRGAYHPGKDWYFVAEVGPTGRLGRNQRRHQAGRQPGLAQRHVQRRQRSCWTTGMRTMKVNDVANLDRRDATRAGRSAWVGPPYGDCGNDRYQGASRA